VSWPRALIRFWGVVPIAFAIALFGLRACIHTEPLDRLRPVYAQGGDPPNAQPLVGSVLVARGGPLIIGFQATAQARLSVSGRELRGSGIVKERILVPPGPLAIRFVASPGARLVWSPVGRRGDPEYVPASSISPDPPETATFSSGSGAAISDGVIALLLVLVLVGSLLMLARARLAKVSREMWIALGATFAVALVARWIGLGDQGQTWDEDVNWAAGRNYVTNVLSLDFSERAWIWNFEHPPVMKLLDGIGAQLADGFGPARALSAVWTALGCALLVPIGARLATPRVGVLAAVIAALVPPLVAHGQIVGHESPTVLWWSLGVLLALGVHDDLPETGGLRHLILRMVAVGAAVGIAVASRFVNGLLGPLCVIIIVVRAPREWRRETVIWLWVTVIAALLVFVAVWPRMWMHPIAHLQESLAKLKGLHSPEPFLGMVTNSPGSAYFVVYLFATTPLLMLLAAAGGIARTAVQRTESLLLVVAWLVVPLAVVASPVRQDGVRYVMPCFLALSLLAALGVDWLAARFGARTRHAFAALAAVMALYLGFTLVRTAPYYLDYFGEHVGGAGGVQRRNMLETAWWGEGVDRAVAYVNEHAKVGSIIDRDCILPAHLAWFREDLWPAMTGNANVADYIVWYSPFTTNCVIPKTLHEVFTVTHDGAVMARVFARQ
jgi:4-amino-4-deoxy-L-arabinose transferase-like glycosyltransferase